MVAHAPSSTADRPRTVQEIRGMPPVTRNRTQKYSPASYAAQYGITTEDAQEIHERSENHQQVERAILTMYRSDPELKARALFRESIPPLTEEERRRFERSGIDPSLGDNRRRSG